MPEQTPTAMSTCPMAETCRGMLEKPLWGIAFMVPGLVFIALGILIIIEPRILAWVIAALFIFLGVMMLMMSYFVRKIDAPFSS